MGTELAQFRPHAMGRPAPLAPSAQATHSLVSFLNIRQCGTRTPGAPAVPDAHPTERPAPPQGSLATVLRESPVAGRCLLALPWIKPRCESHLEAPRAPFFFFPPLA